MGHGVFGIESAHSEQCFTATSILVHFL
jgi:hypothetical protein